MPGSIDQVTNAAQMGFAAQDRELDVARARRPLSVVSQFATGTGDLDEAISMDRSFRLIFIRCHFSGTSGAAPFDISVDSGSGPAYDTGLFAVDGAGVDNDVHLRIGPSDNAEPSAWTFQTNDALRIQWTNPDSGNITWGLEVGLAGTS